MSFERLLNRRPRRPIIDRLFLAATPALHAAKRVFGWIIEMHRARVEWLGLRRVADRPPLSPDDAALRNRQRRREAITWSCPSVVSTASLPDLRRKASQLQ